MADTRAAPEPPYQVVVVHAFVIGLVFVIDTVTVAALVIGNDAVDVADAVNDTF